MSEFVYAFDRIIKRRVPFLVTEKAYVSMVTGTRILLKKKANKQKRYSLNTAAIFKKKKEAGGSE